MSAEATAEKVLFDIEAGVATITLNDPDTRNALSQEMLGGLTAAFERARDHGDARCIVVRSSHEKTFSSGANLGGFAGDIVGSHVYRWITDLTYEAP